ncbi:hypothetical protein BaRGS_00039701 [Batillaria attramentaria]|uniref:Uncharacterized protein n=1 Tax=Batillaria attramentaria TaxID=370345 RepID=A0ABD0J2A9_9CAEN
MMETEKIRRDVVALLPNTTATGENVRHSVPCLIRQSLSVPAAKTTGSATAQWRKACVNGKGQGVEAWCNAMINGKPNVPAPFYFRHTLRLPRQTSRNIFTPREAMQRNELLPWNVH